MSSSKFFYFSLGVTFLVCFAAILYVLITGPTTDDELFSSLFESNSHHCNLSKQLRDGQNEVEFPYLVFVRTQVNSSGYSGCSGILINKRLVLTDAHCIQRRTNIEVFVGSSSGDPSFWDFITNKYKAKVERIFVVIK